MKECKLEAVAKFLYSRFFLRIFKDDTRKRKRIAAQFARGKVLDVGCAWSFNEMLPPGTVGFDIEDPPNSLPGNYAQYIQGDAHHLSKYLWVSKI